MPQIVVKRIMPTQTALTLSNTRGRTVALIAEITTDAGIPLGKVRFTANGRTLDVVNLEYDGTAVLNVRGLGRGHYRMRARFLPSDPGLYGGSVSVKQRFTATR